MQLKNNGLPNETIMDVLNKPQNNEIRSGYCLGILNQRGVNSVDPTGKPELTLAKEYNRYAKAAEELGYSRFAETLREISVNYSNEAEKIKEEYNQS